MTEQRRRAQLRKMLGARPLRFSRWMQRIRQQQKPVGERCIFGRRHRRLPSAVGMTAGEDPSPGQRAQCGDRLADPFAILCRLRRKRRTMRSQPAVRQIVTQNKIALGRELFRDRFQQRSVAVRSRAMRDRQSIARSRLRRMKPAPYRFRFKESRRQFRLSPTPSAGRRRSIARSANKERTRADRLRIRPRP